MTYPQKRKQTKHRQAPPKAPVFWLLIVAHQDDTASEVPQRPAESLHLSSAAVRLGRWGSSFGVAAKHLPWSVGFLLGIEPALSWGCYWGIEHVFDLALVLRIIHADMEEWFDSSSRGVPCSQASFVCLWFVLSPGLCLTVVLFAACFLCWLQSLGPIAVFKEKLMLPGTYAGSLAESSNIEKRLLPHPKTPIGHNSTTRFTRLTNHPTSWIDRIGLRNPQSHNH